jgi:hypothetical protein
MSAEPTPRFAAGSIGGKLVHRNARSRCGCHRTKPFGCAPAISVATVDVLASVWQVLLILDEEQTNRLPLLPTHAFEQTVLRREFGEIPCPLVLAISLRCLTRSGNAFPASMCVGYAWGYSAHSNSERPACSRACDGIGIRPGEPSRTFVDVHWLPLTSSAFRARSNRQIRLAKRQCDSRG